MTQNLLFLAYSAIPWIRKVI